MSDTPVPSSSPASPAPAPSKKRRSWGRFFFRTFLVLFVLVIVGLGILYLSLDGLIRSGVIRGGKYATSQDTGLVLAKLAFVGGANTDSGISSLNLSKLDIQNIQDKVYKEPKILTMNSCDVEVDRWSLFSDTVKIKRITITGLEMTLEQNGMKNNLSELMEQIKKNTPVAATPQPAGAKTANAKPADAPGKKLKIDKLTLAGTKVHIRGMFNLDFDLGPIELDDPTNPDGRDMKIADLVSKILIHVAQQIVDNPKLPGDMKNQMKNVTALVDNMRKDLDKDLKDITNVKNLQDLGKNVQNLGKDAENAAKGLQDAGKGLQNLIGGNKTPATKP